MRYIWKETLYPPLRPGVWCGFGDTNPISINLATTDKQNKISDSARKVIQQSARLVASISTHDS